MPSLEPFSVTHAAFAGFVVWVILTAYNNHKKTPNVTSAGFPAIPIPIIGSWIAAIRFLHRPVEVLNQGISKSKNGLVRISTHQGEYVLVTDREKVAEYLRAPDSVLNMQDGANDQQQIPFTMGYGVGHRTYHTAVVKGPITKSIVPKTPIMVEEAQLALDALIGAPTDFEPICLYDVITMTVARVTNRIYVGTEFCRNTSYLRHAADYAQAVVLSAEFLRVFPEWLKPIVTKFLPVTSHRQKAEKFLSKFIQDRLDGTASKNGEKPTDLVQWLIDAAPPIEKTISQLAERVMALNVASIHTTTMTLTAALYSLAGEPEKYIEPLRAEVLANLENGEITASTLTKLEKMDSFLRESGRCNNLGLMAMQRNARQEFKFSDGTIIPAGAKLGSPSLILHMDPEVYTNPETFDGFRFCRHPGAVEESWKTIVTTGSNFHVFGSGRHPCPGRFLAAHEMKILFSLLLLRYDMKLVPGTKPQPFYIATMPIPDTQLQVLFKARE